MLPLWQYKHCGLISLIPLQGDFIRSRGIESGTQSKQLNAISISSCPPLMTIRSGSANHSTASFSLRNSGIYASRRLGCLELILSIVPGCRVLFTTTKPQYSSSDNLLHTAITLLISNVESSEASVLTHTNVNSDMREHLANSLFRLYHIHLLHGIRPNPILQLYQLILNQ